MKNRINDLNSQTNIVVKQLITTNKLSREDALNKWMYSKTKEELEKRKLFYVSGIRCYVELMYELNNDPKWMKDAFE